MMSVTSTFARDTQLAERHHTHRDCHGMMLATKKCAQVGTWKDLDMQSSKLGSHLLVIAS